MNRFLFSTEMTVIEEVVHLNKFWSHIAPFSRLYLVKLKVVVQLKSQ